MKVRGFNQGEKWLVYKKFMLDFCDNELILTSMPKVARIGITETGEGRTFWTWCLENWKYSLPVTICTALGITLSTLSGSVKDFVKIYGDLSLLWQKWVVINLNLLVLLIFLSIVLVAQQRLPTGRNPLDRQQQWLFWGNWRQFWVFLILAYVFRSLLNFPCLKSTRENDVDSLIPATQTYIGAAFDNVLSNIITCLAAYALIKGYVCLTYRSVRRKGVPSSQLAQDEDEFLANNFFTWSFLVVALCLFVLIFSVFICSQVDDFGRKAQVVQSILRDDVAILDRLALNDLFCNTLLALSMLMLVGRLESRVLRVPAGIIALVYGYALLQVAGVGAQYANDSVREAIQPIMYMVAAVLKIPFFFFIIWLIDERYLLFYLGTVREVETNLGEKWATFLSVPDPPNSIGPPTAIKHDQPKGNVDPPLWEHQGE